MNHKNKIRIVWATISGWGFTFTVVAALQAYMEYKEQAWGSIGLSWLAFDFWTRIEPWKPAACGGVLTLILALLGGRALTVRNSELLGPNDSGIRLAGDRLTSVIRWGVASFGRPLVAVVLIIVAHRLPSSIASLTRPTAPPGSPNIVVLVIDSLRADHCGFLGYKRPTTPGLDNLAKGGIVFEKAISSSGWTKPAVGTLFTGLIPSNHGAVSRMSVDSGRHGAALEKTELTVTEILRNQGWRTGVFSNNPNVLHKYGFTQGVEHFANYWEVLSYEAGRTESMTSDVTEWINGLKTEDPFFAYLHLMDTHYPYYAPAPFAGTWDQSGLDLNIDGDFVKRQIQGQVTVKAAELNRIIDLYDESILYSDAHLTPFIEGLLQEHPNTIVILVADHGEEFLDHGHLGHGHSLFQELVHVPLVIWAPNLEPKRISYQVRLMDIFPSLLEWANLSSPYEIQGKPLQPIISGEENGNRMAPMETGGDQQPPWHWRALSDGNWKWISREDDLPYEGPQMTLFAREESGPYSLLFNLDSDPNEQVDLLATNPTEARRLKERMDTSNWYFPPSHILTLTLGQKNPISEEEAARLSELGYAGSEETDHGN